MAVRRVKGVVNLEGSAKDKRVRVEFDPAVTTPQEIAGAMLRVGYEATPLDQE